MPKTDKTIIDLREEVKNLKRENIDLKKRVTNLSEIPTPSCKRTCSWVNAIEANQDGVWDWNLITNEVFFQNDGKKFWGIRMRNFSIIIRSGSKGIIPTTSKP